MLYLVSSSEQPYQVDTIITIPHENENIEMQSGCQVKQFDHSHNIYV